MHRTVRIGVPALCAGLIFLGGSAWGQHPGHESGEGVKVEVRVPHVEVIELDGKPGRHAVFIGDGPGRGHVGVEVLPLTEELRRHFGVPEDRGIMISRVVPDSPAETAGLEAADIVTAIDGEMVDSPAVLSRTVRGKQPGDSVSLEVWRDGRPETFAVEVAERRAGLEIAPEGFVLPQAEIFEQLHRYFDGEQWQERVQRLQSLDWKSIDERMREVEERLRQLEEQVEETEP